MYITGSYDSKTAIESGDICLSINSVGTLDGKEVYGDNEPEKMKELLGLSNERPIEINYKVIVNDDASNNSLTESRPAEQIASNNRSC